jgi:uncharacterized protein (DUF2141 family)
MNRRIATATALAAATLALAAAAAAASAMNPRLGARLSGMGAHGTVNLQVTASSGKLCWTFDIPSVKAPTRATIRTGQSGAMPLELGMDYTKTGCAKESAMTLDHLESKPGAYSVWVDTKAHPGEVRGTLFAGVAHM